MNAEELKKMGILTNAVHEPQLATDTWLDKLNQGNTSVQVIVIERKYSPHESLDTAEVYNSTEMTLTLHTSLLHNQFKVGGSLFWRWSRIENVMGFCCTMETLKEHKTIPENSIKTEA